MLSSCAAGCARRPGAAELIRHLHDSGGISAFSRRNLQQVAAFLALRFGWCSTAMHPRPFSACRRGTKPDPDGIKQLLRLVDESYRAVMVRASASIWSGPRAGVPHFAWCKVLTEWPELT